MINNTERDLGMLLPTLPAVDPDLLRALHDRLGAAAQREGLLDLAYRTVDSRASTDSCPSLAYATRTSPCSVAASSSVPTGLSTVR